MQHAQPFDRPFPWRSAALAATALALAELAALLALAGIRLIHVHHPPASTPAATTPATTVAEKPTRPLRPRSRVSVLVLNGNGIAHAAGDEAQRLLAQGYRSTYPTDAPNAYARSMVLFRPGWEQEAKRLARDAKILTVAPLDGRLGSGDARYQLVVILGAN